jgi:hypothetical protein
MKVYLNKIEAIIGLHERGFTEDFELFGTDLLWVQKKYFYAPEIIILLKFTVSRSCQCGFTPIRYPNYIPNPIQILTLLPLNSNIEQNFH